MVTPSMIIVSIKISPSFHLCQQFDTRPTVRTRWIEACSHSNFLNSPMAAKIIGVDKQISC